LANYSDYLGLVESRNKIIFSITAITHRIENDKVEFNITFSILNPTSDTKLKFSSLQCQLYSILDGEDEFIGETGYSLPFDVPLPPEEIITYTTRLSVSKDNFLSLTKGVIEDKFEWEIRNVVQYSTSIRGFYQNFNSNQIIRHQNQ
jgi:hypothetical protein